MAANRVKMTTIKFTPFRAEQIGESNASGSEAAHLPQHPRRMEAPPATTVSVASTAHHLNECDQEVKLSIDVPGVRAKDLVVEVDDGVLRVSGERKIGVGKTRTVFERSFRMDQSTIDTSRVTANLSAGVLVVTVPKRDKPARQVIAVTEVPHEFEEEQLTEAAPKRLDQENDSIPNSVES